jgi:hypothetical protein
VQLAEQQAAAVQVEKPTRQTRSTECISTIDSAATAIKVLSLFHELATTTHGLSAARHNACENAAALLLMASMSACKLACKS